MVIMNYKLFCIINSVGALVSGLFVYLFFREQTYLHTWLDLFVEFPNWSCVDFIGADFIRYYFPDYLWGYSLSFALCCFMNTKKARILLPAVMTFVLGCAWELAQGVGWISGTGDLIDVLMYLTAGITVAMINIFKLR